MTVTRRKLIAWAAAAGVAGMTGREGAAAESNTSVFPPDLDLLKQYRAPDWFRDAKLGIWACWGPEAVPEMGDWYARNRYVEGHAQYEDHLKRYGHPSTVGYKNMVALWKGENWNPGRLMQLYKKAGVRYFCAIAQHYDNFDCWNSTHRRWNSVNRGPMRDVIGTWRDLAREHGLRFGVTEHLGASWDWYGITKQSDKTGKYAGVPYDGADPRYAGLYHAGHQNADWKNWYRNVPESFQVEWFNRIKDLVDRYQPDLLYSDGSLPFGKYGRTLSAHFYNSNAARQGGNLQAVYTCKKSDDGGQFADGMCVQHVERGVQDAISADPWQTDTCVGDWYYKRGIPYKTPTLVIPMLVDIVSKNGNFLLNFPQRADGSLDSEEQRILEAFAEWMSVNGEAIYGTRPWKVYGEGDARIKGGSFHEGNVVYSARDLRFTTKDSHLYAIALAWPESGKLTIRSLAGAHVQAVNLVHGGEVLQWIREPNSLTIQMPSQKRGHHAFALRIAGAV
jgi:alpha-L-fucosidase